MSSRESDEKDENGAGLRTGGNVQTKGASKAPPAEGAEKGDEGVDPSERSESSPKE